MCDVAAIREVLTLHDVTAVGEIVADSDGLRRYFVTIPVRRDRDNRQVPSNRRLEDIKTLLSREGITVIFLLHDAEAQDLETGLRATLLHSHIEHIRNAFLSVDGRTVHVWVETKRELEATHYADMSKRSGEFLDLAGLELASLRSISEATLPSQMACMAAIRSLAPATLKVIERYLVGRGFTVPSEQWLTRRLDAVRRAGKIVRLGAGTYALSAEGLRALGTAKHRGSPDVARMLALARTRR